ncbi:MAG: enoyl-CoA hydratase/isomerase family protein [Pseudomonadota bacterium]
MSGNGAGGEIVFRVDGAIARLTIDRPAKLNAITVAMAKEFVARCREVDARDDVRVLIVDSVGDRSFSAGSDIAMLDDLGTPWDGRNRMEQDRDYIHPLLNLRKPAIAAISGYCLGGGLEIAMACDIRVGTKESSFGAMEIQRGWHAGSGNTTILPRLIGYSNAARWVLTGDRFSAEDAYRVGFLQELVDIEDLEPTVAAIAERIAQNPPIAVQSAKNLIRNSQGTSIQAGLAWENDMYTYCMATEDAAEGIQAFVEKRPPVFQGR